MSALQKRLWLLASLALPLLAACSDARPDFDAHLMDQMVLQRNAPVIITGTARPDEEITLTLGPAEARTRAGADGRWRAELPPLQPATGLTLRAAAPGGSASRADVAIGDVFLCSGQSNMAWPVNQALNPERELEGPYREDLRLLHVPHTASLTPQTSLPPWAGWRAASRDEVMHFSALCYFFGRDWQAQENVPVGLISASWGGARIEPWISEAGLRRAPHLAERLDLLETYRSDPAAAIAAYGDSWEAWWQASAGTSPWRDGLDAPRPVPGALRDWKEFGDPDLEDYLGLVWHERRITLTDTQAAGSASLSLGGIDEIDAVWVNGNFIASSFGWGTPREYTLPAGTLKAGENHILVNVYNSWGAGGMTGPETALALKPASGARISLAGDWHYQKVPPETGLPPQMPWTSVAGLAGMHNGMIAPLGNMKLAGALWYQGESNVGEPETYETLLRLLTDDFRQQFGDALPMIVIQLPEFGARMTLPGNSGWSALRDVQRRFVVSDDNAALVVTLGAGDEWDIHPPNKQAAARRTLAVWSALAADPASAAVTGHSPVSAERAEGTLLITLPQAADAYATPGHHSPVGFIICRAGGESCTFARARLEGNEIELDNPYPDASLVRYCWGDTPFCNLTTPEGTPVTPFELALD